jgi:hypothetical protein
MYLRLIATAMDKRHASKVHPAFAEIIKQLSGFEAGILQAVLRMSHMSIIQIRREIYDETKKVIEKFQIPQGYSVLQTHVAPLRSVDGASFANQDIPALVDNWIRLGIVDVSYDTGFVDEGVYDWVTKNSEYLYWVPQDAPPRQKISFAKGQFRITNFGAQFAVAIGLKDGLP